MKTRVNFLIKCPNVILCSVLLQALQFSFPHARELTHVRRNISQSVITLERSNNYAHHLLLLVKLCPLSQYTYVISVSLTVKAIAMWIAFTAR
jgi:hypothetical protein